MQNERRKEPRCIIDTPLFCSVQIQTGDTIICIINDISLNGAMLIVPPDDQDLLPVGQQITFAEVPEQFIATLLNMRATIAWSKDKICGLHFATPLPLTEEGLIAIVTSIENTTSPGLGFADEQDAVATDFTKTEKF